MISNFGSATISVLRNTTTLGSITASSFATKVDFNTGNGPWTVAIADIDGDGKPDLMAANTNSISVSVLRNTSTPGSITASSFAAKVDFATASSPQFFAFGDLDGDGKPDLAIPNYNFNSIAVLRNTSTSGSITASSFAAAVNFTSNTGPIFVAITDLDGDGKPDLAAANNSSNTLSVFRNISTPGSITPSFASKVDFTTGSSPLAVAIGDLDNDGISEIVEGNDGSNTVSVFKINSPLPNLSIDDVTHAEGNAGTTTFTYTVSLSAISANPVTFDIVTADNTATTADNDYAAKSLTSQSIPAGSTTYTFDVLVNGDVNVETNESFFVNVSGVSGANIAKGQGLGTITNDDNPT